MFEQRDSADPPKAGTLSRRRLLTTVGAGTLALTFPPGLRDAVASGSVETEPASWRRLFVLDGDPLYMNVGTVGSPPLEVLRTMEREHRRVAREALSGYSTFDDLRKRIAPGFGCDYDELVISGNTTDGMCNVLAGLALREGDEILTTNHEHPGANAPMAILRDRRRVTIRRVQLPVGNGQHAEDYVSLFERAVTSRTRVMVFSAPTYLTGTMLAIRMLAELAQRHGLVTVVDGAHVPGMMAARFRELGVDFLAGSGAKWQCGPAKTGVLYLRNKIVSAHNPNPLPEFWPTVSMTYPLEGGLPPRTSTDAETHDIGGVLQEVGSGSLTQIVGFAKACEIWDGIGRRRIQDHVLGLASHLKDAIAERWGVDALYSPKDDPRLPSALTTFNPFARAMDVLDATKVTEFVDRLSVQHHIVIRTTQVPVIGSATPHHPVRVSTHLFHGQDDVNRFVDAAWRLSRAMA